MWGGNAARINQDIEKSEGVIELTEKLPENLFNANFEAWKYGPVDIDVYKKHKENKYKGNILSLTGLIDAPISIQSPLLKFVDSVLKQVFEINDFSLVSITQDDKVWGNAYKNKEDIKMNNEDIIREYRDKLTIRIKKDKE